MFFSDRIKINLLPIAQCMIVFALLAKAVLPQGFMPSADANGLFPLVICSSAGTKTVFVTADKIPDMPQGHQQPDNSAHAGEGVVCAFAAVFGSGLLPLADHVGQVFVDKQGLISAAVQTVALPVFSVVYPGRAPPRLF